jgi:hypothetical protein
MIAQAGWLPRFAKGLEKCVFGPIYRQLSGDSMSRSGR